MSHSFLESCRALLSGGRQRSRPPVRRYWLWTGFGSSGDRREARLRARTLAPQPCMRSIHVGFEEPQRLLSVRALQDGEASVFEHVGRNYAHEHFVLDEEDHERVVHQCILLPWSSGIPQPAVIRSWGKSREGPGTAMKSPAGSAERTRSYKRPPGVKEPKMRA